MEIAEILNIVFSGTTLCGVIATIVYRRQNKRIKESEAKQAESTATVSDVEAQKAKIDLGEIFVEKVGSMFQQMEALQKQGSGNQAKIMSMLESLQGQLNRQDELLENLQIEVNNQKSFLDGPYTQWLAEKQKMKQLN